MNSVVFTNQPVSPTVNSAGAVPLRKGAAVEMMVRHGDIKLTRASH
jgi:hypothetical protein